MDDVNVGGLCGGESDYWKKYLSECSTPCSNLVPSLIRERDPGNEVG